MREMISIPPDGRWAFRELLLLADPEEQAIRRYLGESEMYALRVEGRIVCEAVVREEENGCCELMNLATVEEAQGMGYASTLVRGLMRRYSAQCREMFVGTSEAGIGFYERLGFERAYVRRNFFIDNYMEPIFEQGRQCVDMHVLRAELVNE